MYDRRCITVATWENIYIYILFNGTIPAYFQKLMLGRSREQVCGILKVYITGNMCNSTLFIHRKDRGPELKVFLPSEKLYHG